MKSPQHFPFVKIDEFIVMPDHVHGILFISYKNHPLIRPQNLVAPPHQPSSLSGKFGPQSQNLASIIRGFKIGITKNAREKTQSFAWQSRFHDHIIRDESSLDRIRRYIKNNPKHWGKDKYQL